VGVLACWCVGVLVCGCVGVWVCEYIYSVCVYIHIRVLARKREIEIR